MLSEKNTSTEEKGSTDAKSKGLSEKEEDEEKEERDRDSASDYGDEEEEETGDGWDNLEVGINWLLIGGTTWV